MAGLATAALGESKTGDAVTAAALEGHGGTAAARSIAAWGPEVRVNMHRHQPLPVPLLCHISRNGLSRISCKD